MVAEPDFQSSVAADVAVRVYVPAAVSMKVSLLPSMRVILSFESTTFPLLLVTE